MSNPSLAKQRGLARRRAMQAIYQWQMAGTDLADIEAQFCTEQDMAKVDLEYFKELLHGVPKIIDELDPGLEKHMDRKMEELDPIERAILRIAMFEFVRRLDIPYKVVLNEAIILAKAFGSDNSHTYVNGVLDKAAHEIRNNEIS